MFIVFCWFLGINFFSDGFDASAGDSFTRADGWMALALQSFLRNSYLFYCDSLRKKTPSQKAAFVHQSLETRWC